MIYSPNWACLTYHQFPLSIINPKTPTEPPKMRIRLHPPKKFHNFSFLQFLFTIQLLPTNNVIVCTKPSKNLTDWGRKGNMRAMRIDFIMMIRHFFLLFNVEINKLNLFNIPLCSYSLLVHKRMKSIINSISCMKNIHTSCICCWRKTKIIINNNKRWWWWW